MKKIRPSYGGGTEDIMKRFISLLLILCLLAVPFGTFAEEDESDFRVVAVCSADDIRVGDQFLVQIVIDGEYDGYLTYSVTGTFDPAVAELIAPVYKDDGFSIIYNKFSNEDGKFQFDAADLSLRGSEENLLCSLLFEAKSEGDFELVLDRPEDDREVMVGRLHRIGEKYMYSVESVGLTVHIDNDATNREKTIIIEELKPVTPYDDMAGYNWAEVAVGALARLGILNGIADESFEPEKEITRGEFVAMLVRAAKLSGAGDNFPDVAENYPFAAEISTAKKKGIALGDENGNFDPESPATRQDISAFVYRTLHLLDKMDEAPVEVLADFSDSDKISDYAVPTMASVVRAKLLKGDDRGLLNPVDNMTRVDAAVLIESVIVHIKLVL